MNALPMLLGLPLPEQKERVVEIDSEDRIWVDQHFNDVRRCLRRCEVAHNRACAES